MRRNQRGTLLTGKRRKRTRNDKRFAVQCRTCALHRGTRKVHARRTEFVEQGSPRFRGEELREFLHADFTHVGNSTDFFGICARCLLQGINGRECLHERDCCRASDARDPKSREETIRCVRLAFIDCGKTVVDALLPSDQTGGNQLITMQMQ